MKALGILLLLAGVAGILLGGYEMGFNNSRGDCDRFRLEALALLQESSTVEGTPREMELLEEAETKNMLADISCEAAGHFLRRGLLILATGVVLAIVGFALVRRRKVPPPAAA